MKKKLLSLSVVGIVLFALASGAYASAVLDPDNGGSYHFTWGTGGIIAHVFAVTGTSIVPGNWNESWTINSTHLGDEWSITVAQDSKIDFISVWQKPDIAGRVTFNVLYDGDSVAWTSINASGPFQGTIENLSVSAGTHTIGITAVSDDGGSFAQFSGTTPTGPGSCVWDLEPPTGGDSDVDGLDFHAALSDLDIPAQLAAFALEFGRTNCP